MADKPTSHGLFPKVIDTSQGSKFSHNVETQMQHQKRKKWANYVATRGTDQSKTLSYRRGPAPIEDINFKSEKRSTANGTIDSDLDGIIGSEEEGSVPEISARGILSKRKSSAEVDKSTRVASCKALLIYFSKLGKSIDDHDEIDFNFLSALIACGADINIRDKHGQTILHEVARAWHTDVLRFVYENGGDINKADDYGRTPLHVASMVNYPEMAELLIGLGASISAKTTGEDQSPIHYAAKNNAIASMKMLLKLGANINDRDYKKRTPILLAAENAQPEAARFLLEFGAPVGVYDDSGTSCFSLMIAKMPNIAMEAVEQFHHLDLAFRKHYFYLSYLEHDPHYLEPEPPKSKKEKMYEKEMRKDINKTMNENVKKAKKAKNQKTFAKTPLEVIVQYNQMDLLTHPVFQQLISVKWKLFGKLDAVLMACINFLYTVLWTALGATLPDDRKYYSPLGSRWWRLALDILGVLLTLLFIFREISSLKQSERNYTLWRVWRTLQVKRDAPFCHPRWPEDKHFIDSEIKQIRSYKRTYFRQGWNIFEWFSYACILLLIVTRIVAVMQDSSKPNATESLPFNLHTNAFPCVLLVIWLRFMRSCRPFKGLGVFIAILSYVIVATLKFAFLFFEFYIPYVVGFWIMFGGDKHAKLMGADAIDWRRFNDLLYSVWQLFVGDSFNWDGLVAVDRLMAQVLVGTYLALVGGVCFHLYIALLSRTFTDAYRQAQATALMQQARVIISVEKSLSKKKKIKFGHFMQNECSPLEIYTLTEGHTAKDQRNMLFDKIVRQSSNRILEFEEILHKNLKIISPYKRKKPGRRKGKGGGSGRGIDGDERNQDSDRDGQYIKVTTILPLIKKHAERIQELENMVGEFRKTIQEELGEVLQSNSNKKDGKIIGSLLGKFKNLRFKSSAERDDDSLDLVKGDAKERKVSRQENGRQKNLQRRRYSVNDLDMRREKEETDLVDDLKVKARNLLGLDSYSPDEAEPVTRKQKPKREVNLGFEGTDVGRKRRSKRKGEVKEVKKHNDEDSPSDPISCRDDKMGQRRSRRQRGQRRRYSTNDLEMRRHIEEVDLIDVLKAKARDLLGIDSNSPEKEETASRKTTERKHRSKASSRLEGTRVNQKSHSKGNKKEKSVREHVDDNEEESSEYEEGEESIVKNWLRQKLQ